VEFTTDSANLAHPAAHAFKKKVTVSCTEVGGYCAECLQKMKSEK
jgi:hypothetical protein